LAPSILRDHLTHAKARNESDAKAEKEQKRLIHVRPLGASRKHRLLLASKTVDVNQSNRRGSKMRPEGKWVWSQAPAGHTLGQYGAGQDNTTDK
jgi:hypothetical protein